MTTEATKCKFGADNQFSLIYLIVNLFFTEVCRQLFNLFLFNHCPSSLLHTTVQLCFLLFHYPFMHFPISFLFFFLFHHQGY